MKKKVSITAVLIAVATTLATITIALMCYETETQGQIIDGFIALIWMGGMLTAYAEQLKHSEKNRVKRWEE
jgi:hypothetical protein